MSNKNNSDVSEGRTRNSTLGPENKSLEKRSIELLRDHLQAEDEDREIGMATSIRLKRKEREFLREIVQHGPYTDISDYIRHAALGWEKDGDMVAASAVVMLWLEQCVGEAIQEDDWSQLHEALENVLVDEDPRTQSEEKTLREYIEMFRRHLVEATRQRLGDATGLLPEKEKASTHPN